MNSASLLKAGIHDFLAAAAATTSARRGAGLAATEAALASKRWAPRNGVLSTAAGAVAEVDASAMAWPGDEQVRSFPWQSLWLAGGGLLETSRRFDI
jgi:hypothetical protein